MAGSASSSSLGATGAGAWAAGALEPRWLGAGAGGVHASNARAPNRPARSQRQRPGVPRRAGSEPELEVWTGSRDIIRFSAATGNPAPTLHRCADSGRVEARRQLTYLPTPFPLATTIAPPH